MLSPAPAAEPAPTPPPLSLEDAIQCALSNNLSLARSATGLDAASFAAQAALEDARHVSVSPVGAASASDDASSWRSGLEVGTTLPPGTRLSIASLASSTDLDDASASRRAEIRASVSQPLFKRFGSLVQMESARLADESFRAARRAWERDRSALVVSVVERYEELVCLRQKIESHSAQARRLLRLLRLAEARERRGLASPSEVLRLRLQLGEAEARVESSRAALSSAFEAFADMLGLPLDSRFSLSPPPLLDLDVPEPSAALDLALRLRPDMAQAAEDVSASRRSLLLARRALLPDLSLSASHSFYGQDSSWSGAAGLDDSEWRVSLEGAVDFNAASARLDSRRAAAKLDASRQSVDIVRRRIALEVSAARTEFFRARRDLALASENRNLADSRAALARALFEAGRASADSVSDAEADALSSVLAELEAHRAASVAAYRLLHVLGSLLPCPEDLLQPKEISPP